MIFVNDTARQKMVGWYQMFRASLTVPTEARIVETPEGPTHVLIAGPEDAPPLVCLHGALASSAHVMPELGSLVEHYRVYAVDVMGQSVMSADRRIDVRDDSYGRWLVAVARGLGLDHFALFGVSWGGFVAVRAAKVAPEMIDALVLMVPAGVVASPAWAGFTRLGWPMLTYRFAPSEKRLRRLVDAMFTTYDERWHRYFGDAVLSYKMDMRIPPLATPEDLAAFAARKRPTLVLAADDDVSFPGAPLLARMKELVPHAEGELLDDCKHCPPFDPSFRAKTASRIRTFLKASAL